MSQVRLVWNYLKKQLDEINTGWDSLSPELVMENQVKSKTYKKIMLHIQEIFPDENFEK